MKLLYFTHWYPLQLGVFRTRSYIYDRDFCGNSLLLNAGNSLREASRYGDFSGLYFPAFGPNTEIYSVNLRIQCE